MILATRVCSDLKHSLGVGKGLQFVKTVVVLGNAGSAASRLKRRSLRCWSPGTLARNNRGAECWSSRRPF